MKPLIFLCSFCCIVASLIASTTLAQPGLKSASAPIGSTNLIAPLATGPSPNQSATKGVVVRHPTQAGNVSKTMSGTFVPSARLSWIAKGDKRYSLCATTSRGTVVCSPLLPASLLDDMEVSTSIDKRGRTVMSFKIEPGTKRHSKALARSAGMLMQRVAKMSAHLERRAVSRTQKPEESFVRTGTARHFVAEEGGRCGSYDDFGSYDCEGGGDGGDGGGGSGGCKGECDYPPGNDNGDPPPGAFDPTTGEGVDPNAPEVIIVGQRPEQGTVEPPPDWIHFPPPMPEPIVVPAFSPIEPVIYIPAGCIPGPRGTFVCPPVTSSPFPIPKLPPNSAREWQWSAFRWCKVWNNCGPIISEGDAPKPPATTPGERFLAAMDACRATAKADIEFCVRMESYYSLEQSEQCAHDALENYRACEATAIDIRERY